MFFTPFVKRQFFLLQCVVGRGAPLSRSSTSQFFSSLYPLALPCETNPKVSEQRRRKDGMTTGDWKSGPLVYDKVSKEGADFAVLRGKTVDNARYSFAIKVSAKTQ